MTRFFDSFSTPSRHLSDAGSFQSDSEPDALGVVELSGRPGNNGIDGRSFRSPPRRPGQHGSRGGNATPARPGVTRIEHVWKAIAKSAVLRAKDPEAQLVVLTSGTVRGGPLAAVTGPDQPIRAIVDLTRPDAVDKLAELLDTAIRDESAS